MSQRRKFNRREKMDCSIPACAACAQNCLLIHEKDRDPSAVVTSFFKVMIGDDFSKVLFLPPKFARTMSDLIDKEIQLEDASGHKWMVSISKYRGSLAFQQGWHSFSVEHGLEIGDFLVFNYIMHSHFVVKIYGRSGCQKFKLLENKENGRKRKRTNGKSSVKNKQFSPTDTDTMNGQCSYPSAISGSNIDIKQSQPVAADNTSNTDDGNRVQLFSKMNCIEEPFFFFNRDIGDRQSEHRDSLYDLAEFEMGSSGVSVTKTTVPENDRSHGQFNLAPNSQGESSGEREVPMVKEVQNCLAVPEVRKLEILERCKEIAQTDNNIFVSKNDFGNENTSGKDQSNKTDSGIVGNDQCSVSLKEFPAVRVSGQSSEKKFAGGLQFSGLPISVKPEICFSGKSSRVVKQEQIDMSEEACCRGEVSGKNQRIKMFDQSFHPPIKDNDHAHNVVKAEPIDSIDVFCTIAVIVPFSAVTDKQTYLKLPSRLPSVVSSRAKHKKERKMVVLLRDPKFRMWPVLYCEKYGWEVLTSGWEAFSNANNILPGDECVFGLEDQLESIFKVSIFRK